jgi:UDP-N-acetylmuramate: L-alanyl-gamma-D-glutamyl-meso-diaminopimelate ligase
VKKTASSVMYKDFAHSPSKLKATTQALKTQFPERELIACMELHTFSSLNKEFLNQYDGAMKNADKAFVYYSPKTLAHKKLQDLSPEEVKNAFNSNNITVFTDSNDLVKALKTNNWQNKNLLMMSSGNFDGVDFDKLGEELLV